MWFRSKYGAEFSSLFFLHIVNCYIPDVVDRGKGNAGYWWWWHLPTSLILLVPLSHYV